MQTSTQCSSTSSCRVGSDEDQTYLHAAKEAEKDIKLHVEQIIAANDDQTTMGALDILHKLISK